MRTLRELVQRTLENYFNELEGAPVDLYELVLSHVEPALLAVVLMKAKQNQSQAARWLGISRGTLRKRMKRYGMLESRSAKRFQTMDDEF